MLFESQNNFSTRQNKITEQNQLCCKTAHTKLQPKAADACCRVSHSFAIGLHGSDQISLMTSGAAAKKQETENTIRHFVEMSFGLELLCPRFCISDFFFIYIVALQFV